ncbi:uncharacterized protein N7482_000126 [Penicillium canariense]|uniref:Uncharacterized protein n=1 Tax=Penicillium canariense TaxID=189055 RepID=A0A9W9IAZ5_9EURO|nr:uncharacterized protein N7482_000126 [Penicillium canariense]KAJ5174249.1 hypothetical protein N7482_000126 [Penicillium canariense]
MPNGNDSPDRQGLKRPLSRTTPPELAHGSLFQAPSPPGPSPQPGFNIMRLEGIEQHSDEGKTRIMNSIADDMSATFRCIAHHMREGNLDDRHVDGMNSTLENICDANVKYRLKLEHQVERLRTQRRLMRQEYRGFAREIDTMGQRYRGKVQSLASQVKDLQKEVALLTGEKGLLRQFWEEQSQREKMAIGRCVSEERATDEGYNAQGPEGDADEAWEEESDHQE